MFFTLLNDNTFLISYSEEELCTFLVLGTTVTTLIINILNLLITHKILFQGNLMFVTEVLQKIFYFRMRNGNCMLSLNNCRTLKNNLKLYFL